MKLPWNSALKLAVLALAAHALGGCAVLAVGGAATAVKSFREERPVQTQIDDATIAAQIDTNLVGEGNLFKRVKVTVLEGRVYLKGKVNTQEERITATRVAWRTGGVKEVYNDILTGVDPSLSDAANDTWISTKVRANLLTDGAVKDVNYTIDTQNGTVFLMGIAQNEAEREHAVSVARGVPGVVAVVDYLVLRDDPRRLARAPDQPPAEAYYGEQSSYAEPAAAPPQSYASPSYSQPVTVEPYDSRTVRPVEVQQTPIY